MLTAWWEEDTRDTQADGKVASEDISVPLSKLETERGNIVEYLAALINIRGVLTGGTEVGIEVNRPELISNSDILGAVQEVLKSDFGHTAQYATFGNTISFKEGRLEAYQPGAVGIQGYKYSDIDYNKGEAVGFDIGGTNLKICFIRNGEKLLTETIPLSAIDVSLGDFIEKKFLEIGQRFNFDYTGKPVYVTIPGPVTPEGNIVVITNLEKERPGTTASLELLKSRYAKVRFQNDANSSAFYQMVSGNLKGNVILNTLGTGLGLGIIIDGRLIPGPQEGHIKIKFNKDAFLHEGFNMRGDLEAYASSYFVKNRTAQLARENNVELPVKEEDITPKMVGEWLSMSETDALGKIARQVYKEFGNNLAALYLEICRVTGIKEWAVIFTGGITGGSTSQTIIDGVKEITNKYPEFKINVRVGEDAALSGALASAYLSIQEQYLDAISAPQRGLHEIIPATSL